MCECAGLIRPKSHGDIPPVFAPVVGTISPHAGRHSAEVAVGADGLARKGGTGVDLKRGQPSPALAQPCCPSSQKAPPWASIQGDPMQLKVVDTAPLKVCGKEAEGQTTG